MAVTLNASTSSGFIQTADTSGVLTLQSNGTNALSVSSSNLQFNSGYGSVATAFGCRAWVNFDGTPALPSIRGSGNVASITDNGGSGNYSVVIDNNMPDANYSAVASHSIDFVIRVDNLAVGSFRIICNATSTNAGIISAAVFR
jgi:hypothetical protein